MFKKITKKQTAGVFAFFATLALVFGLVQPAASSADAPFTVTVGNAPTVGTNSTAQFPVTITCRQAGGCAGASISFTRPVLNANGQTYQLQGPMVISLASGANPAITYTTSGLAGDNPSMTFTRLDQNQSQVFNVSWQTTENQIIPGTYSLDWKGTWAAQNIDTSGRSTVAVTGTPKVGLTKSDVSKSGSLFDNSWRQFELQWFREKNGPGLTGVTTELVDKLPPEYVFKGFTETGVGGDMLFRNLQGEGEGVVYFYDAATHTVHVKITESVDRYIARKNTIYSKIRYNVQVDPAKTANLADGAKITNTVTATNPKTLDGKDITVAPSSVTLNYAKTRPGSYSKNRVGGEWVTSQTDRGLADGTTDPGQNLNWTINASNPGTTPRTLTISDTPFWAYTSNNPASVPEGQFGTPSNYHYLTNISLNPVQYNSGLVNYPARIIGYSADGTQKTYNVSAGSPLAIPEADKIVRFDVIVDNFQPMDAVPSSASNGILTVNVTTKYRIETNQITAANNNTSGALRLYNRATVTLEGSSPNTVGAFFSVKGELPSPAVAIQALNANNLQRGQVFYANAAISNSANAGLSRPEAFLALPPGFTLDQQKFLAGRDPAACKSAPEDWAFERVADKSGGQVWRIYLKDPKQRISPVTGNNPNDCFQLAIKAANPRSGTYDKAPLTDPKHTIQMWVHEQPDPGQTNKLSDAAMNIPDVYDVNSDGNTSGQWRNAGTPVAVANNSSIGVSKRAVGDKDGGESTSFVPGGTEQTSLAQKNVDFYVTASTTGTDPVKNMVVYDLLPSGANSGANHVNLINGYTAADNTKVTYEPKLSGPVQLSGHSENVTIYYSTSANPCRPELATTAATGNFPSCTNFNDKNEWTTAPADFSAVKAIRIQFNGTVFGDFDFKVPMTMPTSDLEGKPLDSTDVATNRAAVAADSVAGIDIPAVGPAYARVSPWGEILLDKSSVVRNQNFDETTKAPDVRRGEEFIWVVEATANRDGAAIPDPTLIDRLPAGVEVVGVEKNAPYATKGDATVDGQTVTWKPGTINPGDKAYLYLKVKATGAGDQINYAYYQDPDNPDAYSKTCTAGSEAAQPNCDTNTVHIDAGNAQVSGNYFTDLDQSNTNTAGDEPRAGKAVFLYEVLPDGSLKLVSQKVTDDSGNYSFRDLPAGQYVVGFEKTASAEFVTPNAGTDANSSDVTTQTREEAGFGTVGLVKPFTLAENQNLPNVNAGVYTKAAISGVVFTDSNGDGTRSDKAGDLVQGVTLTLLNADGTPATGTDGTPVAPITTGADGAYRFTNIRPGDYMVQATLPDGATYTYSTKVATAEQIFEPNYNDGAGPFAENPGRTDVFTAKEGENPNVDFGVQPLSSIGGVVFIDANGDSLSEGDAPAKGVTVEAYVMRDGQYTKVAETTTDDKGEYHFNNLAPGSYATRVVKPNEYPAFSPQVANASTATNDGSDAANDGWISFGAIAPGDATRQRGDAGLLPASQLSGEIFYDDNANGIRDNGEQLKTLPLTINLYRVGGDQPVATTQTVDGAWNFDNVTPGDYYIQVINPGKAHFGDLASTYPTDGTTAEKLAQENFNDVVQGPNVGGVTANFTVGSGENIPHIDTGVVRLQSVDGHVWQDDNANGVWDDGEKPMEGVTVNLEMANGQTRTAETDADGYYHFGDVAIGQATVTVVKPDGTKYTTQANTDSGFDAITKPKLSDVSADNGSVTFEVKGYTDPKNPTNTDVVNVDAGLVPLSSVSGTVFDDLNRDGVKDADEPKHEGVTVTLYTKDGKEVASTTTDANGNYTFDGVTPGEYYVVFTAPDGTKFTTQEGDNDADETGKTGSFTVGANAPATNIDAGLITGANISGVAWVDTAGDSNGKLDDGEKFYANAPIELYKADGTLVATTQTAADGTYEFRNVAPGEYYVRVVLPDSAVALPHSTDLADTKNNNFVADGTSAPGGQTPTFTVKAGEDWPNIDLATVPKVGVAGTVFQDLNRDGTQDPGETGIADVPVQIFKVGQDTPIDTVTTDANGNWFSDKTLTDSEYYVVFPTLDGKKITQKLPEADGQLGEAGFNDADPANGRTETVKLVEGQQLNNIDAGYIVNGGISGIAFNDANGDGARGDGEAPYEGFKVVLVDANGKEVATTTTDANGAYSFPGVTPGEYTVKFIPADGLTGQFTSGTTSDVNKEGLTQKITVPLGEEVTNVDAGFAEHASISGIAFVDGDGDALSTGASDSRLAGVKVTLYRVDANGDLVRVAATTTADDGSYRFDGVLPGDYQVRFVNDVLQNAATVKQDANAVGGSDVNAQGYTGTITVEAGKAYEDVDAGYVTKGTISGAVWTDTNNDGFIQDGETPRAGVTVSLLNEKGEVVATAVTADDGTYTFANQPAGTYSVRVEPVDGTVFSPKKGTAGNSAEFVSDVDRATGTTQQFTLEPGKSVTNVDAGVVPATSISGTAFFDSRADGSIDGEQTREGVKVQLLNQKGEVVAETTTDTDGNYRFDNVPVGTYTVSFQQFDGEKFSPAGVDSLVDGNGKFSVTLTEGNPVTKVDAGYVTTAVISGLAFIDANYDGMYGTSDYPTTIPATGVRVELLDADGNSLPDPKIVTVGADGRYSFNVAPGTYRVKFTDQFGQPVTMQVGDPADISAPGLNDADPATGMTAPITVAAGEVVDNVDGGIRSTTSISGRAFVDTTGDQLDGNEPAVSGLTVELVDADGKVVQTVQTAADGTYSFSDVLPGKYTVRFPTQDGKLFSGGDSKVGADGTYAVEITPEMSRNGENVTGVDAGYTADTGTIEGAVFWDDARDDKYDDGDELVTDATVAVVGAGGVHYEGTVEGGKFSFPNLPVGKYTVVIEANGEQIVREVEVTANGVTRVDVPLLREPTTTTTETSPTTETTPTEPTVTAGPTEPTAPTSETSTEETTTTEETTPTAPTSEPTTTETTTTTSTSEQSPTEPTKPTPVPTFNIEGKLWHDANADASVGAAERGLSGVTVELLDASGKVVATTTTGADGSYEFTDVPAGEYTVSVPRTVENLNLINTALPGEGDTVSWGVKVSSTGGGTVTGVNFGYDAPEPTPTPTSEPTETTEPTVTTEPTDPTATTEPTEPTMPTIPTPTTEPSTPEPTVPVPDQKIDISGRLWHDEDQDGTVNGSEKGLAGVTVELRDANGNVVATTTTDADGKFEFTGVPAGNYEIVVPRKANDLDIVNSTNSGHVDGDNWVVKVGANPGGKVTDVNFGYDADPAKPTEPTEITTEPTTTEPTTTETTTEPTSTETTTEPTSTETTEPTETTTEPTETTTEPTSTETTVTTTSTKPSEPSTPGTSGTTTPATTTTSTKPGEPGTPGAPGEPGKPGTTTSGSPTTSTQPGGSTGGSDGGNTGGSDHTGGSDQTGGSPQGGGSKSIPERVSEGLASTGANVLGLIAAALALVAAGIYLISSRRKKQDEQ